MKTIQIANAKEKLFHFRTVSDTLLWNHVVNGSSKKLSLEILEFFLQKHSSSISRSELQLIFQVYSSQRDSCLTKNDFWEIFKPKTIKFSTELVAARNLNCIYSHCFETNYQITDLILQILRETAQFEMTAEQMKKNIKSQREGFVLGSINPQHLQVFMNRNSSIVTLEESEIVFDHIIKNKVPSEKTFYEYFVPCSLNSKAYNPLLQTKASFLQSGLDLMTVHSQISHFGNKVSKLKQPMYLLARK